MRRIHRIKVPRETDTRRFLWIPYSFLAWVTLWLGRLIVLALLLALGIPLLVMWLSD